MDTYVMYQFGIRTTITRQERKSARKTERNGNQKLPNVWSPVIGTVEREIVIILYFFFLLVFNFKVACPFNVHVITSLMLCHALTTEKRKFYFHFWWGLVSTRIHFDFESILFIFRFRFVTTETDEENKKSRTTNNKKFCLWFFFLSFNFGFIIVEYWWWCDEVTNLFCALVCDGDVCLIGLLVDYELFLSDLLYHRLYARRTATAAATVAVCCCCCSPCTQLVYGKSEKHACSVCEVVVWRALHGQRQIHNVINARRKYPYKSQTRNISIKFYRMLVRRRCRNVCVRVIYWQSGAHRVYTCTLRGQRRADTSIPAQSGETHYQTRSRLRHPALSDSSSHLYVYCVSPSCS